MKSKVKATTKPKVKAKVYTGTKTTAELRSAAVVHSRGSRA